MMRSYEKSRDASFKWFYVPYWQAREGLDRAAAATERRESLSSFLSNMLLPAMPKARGAFARSERSNAVLRLLEALRIYAAAHEGRLPDTLGDVTEVPVPIAPFNRQAVRVRVGRPGVCRRAADAGTAVEAGNPDGREVRGTSTRRPSNRPGW